MEELEDTKGLRAAGTSADASALWQWYFEKGMIWHNSSEVVWWASQAHEVNTLERT